MAGVQRSGEGVSPTVKCLAELMPRHSFQTFLSCALSIIVSGWLIGHGIWWLSIAQSISQLAILPFLGILYAAISLLILCAAWIKPQPNLQFIAIGLLLTFLVLNIGVNIFYGLHKNSFWLSYLVLAVMLSPNWLSIKQVIKNS